jgi:transposase
MSRYTPQPSLPEEIAELYEAILQALTGSITVTAAAEKLKLSRVQTHTLLNRAAAGVLESLLPKKPGRKAMPERERQLEEEVERLRKENARLQDRVDTIDRLMGVASGILRGQVRTRSPKTKKKQEPGGSNEPEDPDGEARRKLGEAATLREAGMSAPVAAALVGVCTSTLRRWSRRLESTQPARLRRGPRQRSALSSEKARELELLVREVRGLPGAEALARAVGCSRRQAAGVKRRVLTAMERERIASCTRVVVSEPGVMRSMDQLYLRCGTEQRIALLASDASVAYRTSAALLSAYTACEVARVLRADFAEHGAPLVLRSDNAPAHDAPEVKDLLAKHGVLMLHGPTYYPQYNGQHERQNREHRDWLRFAVIESEQDVDPELMRMLRALNERWPRESLGWLTAAALWSRRRPLHVDRTQLRQDVAHRAARLSERHGLRLRLARRLAIEQALEDRGLLRRIARGWC